MKIDAKIVADHLSMVAMGKRVGAVVLGPHFAAQVADDSDEVMLKAVLSGVKFSEKFGVEKLQDLVKILESFSGEIDAELVKEKDGKDELVKLFLSSGDAKVWYQTADTDKISSTLTSFASADEAISATIVAETTPGAEFLKSFAQYQKRISPDMIEVVLKDKKLVMRMINATSRHRAELVIGDAKTVSKKKFDNLKLSAAVVADTLSCVQPTEGDQLKISAGNKALKVEFRTYTYLLSPRVEAATE